MTETDADTRQIPADELDEIVERKVEQRVEEELEQRQQRHSRRSVLGALAGMAGAGALGYSASGIGAADPSDAAGTVYFEQIGDSNNPVDQLYVNNQTTFNNDETFDNITVNNLADIASASIVDLLAENVVIEQDSFDNVSFHSGNNLTVSGATYQTIFDVASPVDVITGHINGIDVVSLRITWDDGTTDELFESNRARGTDSAGDQFNPMTIPPIKNVSKLEFRNGDSEDSDFGWRVMSV